MYQVVIKHSQKNNNDQNTLCCICGVDVVIIISKQFIVCSNVSV